ncbi:hypothetical protein RIF29_10264 [Crotalaria pallida]|uniref:Uncharacterized protein n=1 Tax=Crotalaria pallida TaxID=3830 RepID=A0AAN9FVT8_CROPI
MHGKQMEFFVSHQLDYFIEEDFVEVHDMRFWKPFVEKPIAADNHNLMIYYPNSTCGGMKEWFRKVDNRSNDFHPNDRRVRREYAHAKARKSHDTTTSSALSLVPTLSLFDPPSSLRTLRPPLPPFSVKSQTTTSFVLCQELTVSTPTTSSVFDCSPFLSI